MKYTDIFNERKTNVCERPKELAYLENQILIAVEGYKCKGRCIFRIAENAKKYGSWKEEGERFDCDLIHTACEQIATTTTTTETPTTSTTEDSSTSEEETTSAEFPPGVNISFLTQIIEQNFPRIPNNSTKKYNVHLIMVDSSSYSQSNRNLPKALYFMLNQLKGVEFPYHNKVAHNSYGNYIPLYFGKTFEDIDQRALGLGIIEQDWKSCKKNLTSDEELDIFTEFRQKGYVTLLNEDTWYNTISSPYPPCLGPIKQIADHVITPLKHAYMKDYGELLKSQIGSCQVLRKSLWDGTNFFTQFVNSYKDRPKFTQTVFVQACHDYESESITMDTELFDLFIRNRKEYDQSFVFFYGDHGLRYGSKMKTKIGKLDNDNPMLVVSIPRELRDGSLYEMMKQNAGKLQTHFDTRATILDILHRQPEEEWKNTTQEQMSGERGNSYLRKQNGERNCHSMPISFNYCICNWTLEPIDEHAAVIQNLAKITLAKVHTMIDEHRASSKCYPWTLERAEAKVYIPANVTGTFEVIVYASANTTFKDAIFKSFVLMESENPKVLSLFRLDRIGDTGECAKELGVEELCYCRKEDS